MSVQRCKAKVSDPHLSFFRSRGCANPAGPDGYCAVHRPSEVAKRQREKEKRWEQVARERRFEHLERSIGRLVLTDLDLRMPVAPFSWDARDVLAEYRRRVKKGTLGL